MSDTIPAAALGRVATAGSGPRPDPRLDDARVGSIGEPVWGALAILGAVIAAVGILGLDATIGSDTVRGRELRASTISEYVYSSGSWVFNLAVLGLAVGSAALVVGLVRSGLLRRRSAGAVLLAAWVVGLLGVVAFPKHNWAVGPSSSGSIHRLASMVAFLSIPLAVLFVVRRCERRASRAAGAAWWLNIGTLAFLTMLVGAILYGAVADASWWRVIPLGLVERGIVGFEVASVVALGVWAIRGRRRSASNAVLTA